ncbi:MAG: ATP-binding protein [Halohasta sp.]
MVYECSESSQAALGARLDGSIASAALHVVTDPVDLVALLAESTPDCLVWQYGTEPTAAAEVVSELLSGCRPGLPRVAYVESTDALRAAHEQGFSAVQLRREADDTRVLAERIRAAIAADDTDENDDTDDTDDNDQTGVDAATADAATDPPRLVAATVDAAGTVRRIAADSSEPAPVRDEPLWTAPWAPSRSAVEAAIDRALAEPHRPVTADSGEAATDVFFAAEPAETAADTPRLIVMTALRTDPAGSPTEPTPAADDHSSTAADVERYERILESVQEMICVIDSTGRIKLLTEPLAQRLGTDRSQLVGQPLPAFFWETDTRGGPLAELFETSSVSTVTFRDSMIIGDESVPVSVEASVLPNAEGGAEAVVTLRDISDLVSAKEAAAAERERFAFLFENLTDPVDEIRMGDDGPTIKGVNSAFRSLFGASAAADADAPPIALDDERIVESEISQPSSDELLADGEWELKVTTTDGTKYFLYRSVSYELGDDRGGFEIYTDITALKQREIQLKVLHRLLRHNLRNDLNVIEGFAEILTRRIDDAQNREYAARIRDNATRLSELSETANTIESVAGHRALDRRPIELGEMVRTVVDASADQYEAAEFTVGELPPATVAAGLHLETAIGELIENAIEHNDADVPRVSVGVGVDGGTATLTVSDNGPGIPPDEWAVVTGDTEISQLEHGSGLGLWLVRWVTEGYGGELSYHDRDPGSAISIRLPLVDVQDP